MRPKPFQSRKQFASSSLNAATRACIERMESRTLRSAAGDLDLSFGGTGKATVDFGNTSDIEGHVAVDSQGRVIVAGYSFQGGDTGVDFAVARFNADGTPDTTFDGDGRATVDFGGTRDDCFSVAVDSKDRILLAGSTRPNESDVVSDFAVARLNTDGSLDTTFDGDGKVTVDFGSTEDFGFGVAVDSLDRVVVGGQTTQPVTGNDFAVARLASDGSLDPTFDGDGKAIIDLGTPDERAYSVAVDHHDRIVIGGFSNQGGTRGYDFTVARLNADGSLDSSFDDDGQASVDFGSNNDTGYSVAVDSLDRVLVGGYTDHGGGTGYDLAVARLVNGTLDPSFNGDGKATVDFYGHDDTQGAVTVDSRDRVLLAGVASGGGTSGDFAVARFNTTGSLDTSFSADGKATIDFGDSSDSGLSVAVDWLGRVLVGGNSFQSGAFDLAVTRLLANAPPVAADDAYTTSEDAPLIVTSPGVLANDSDADGDSLHAILVAAPSHGSLTLNADGSFTYTPGEDFHGTDTFTYKAIDGQSDSNLATVTIGVTQATPGTSIIPDPCNQGNALLLQGTAGDDSIHIDPTGITINGQFLGALPSAARIIIFAHEGNDAVQVSGSVMLPVWMFGGSGNDSLNGGNGDGGVLVGGSGDDQLLGGSGRDLMIGGLGADRLVGNPGDDILIAAYTNYDENLPAICNILDEWTRTDADFDTRVHHLEGNHAGGLNGAVFLNNATVHDDGVVDQIDSLTGSAGNDWYIYDLGLGDKASGVSSTEAGEAITNA